MAYPMGERPPGILRLNHDCLLALEFHDFKIRPGRLQSARSWGSTREIPVMRDSLYRRTTRAENTNLTARWQSVSNWVNVAATRVLGILHGARPARTSLGTMCIGLCACSTSPVLPDPSVAPIHFLSEQAHGDQLEQLRSFLTAWPRATPSSSIASFSSTQIAVDPTETIHPQQPNPLSPGKLNQHALSYISRVENKFYRASSSKDYSWPEGLPNLCVAFSGGGLRSSAFAIGALQGLEDIDLLREVDIISAVSGGAFALAWLYDAHFRTDYAVDQILNAENSPLQNVLNDPQLGVFTDLLVGAIMEPPFHVATLPFNLLQQTGRPQQPHVFSIGRHYKSRIEAIFSSPRSKWSFEPATTLTDIRTHISDSDNELPYPIINASVLSIESDDHCQAEKNQVNDPLRFRLPFEITPLRVGNDKIGYTDIYSRSRERGIRQTELFDWVAASGAAVDSPAHAICQLTNVIGGSGPVIPRYVGSDDIFILPKETAALSRIEVNVREFEVEDESFTPSTKVSGRLRLGDGGDADNLGLFPLAKRFCKSTIVFDATHDPYLVFDDLIRTQELLEDSELMNAKLDVESIVRVFGGETSTRKFLGCTDRASCSYEALLRCPGQNECNRADELPRRVFPLSLGSFSWGENEFERSLDLDVFHVKLGMDRVALEKFPGSVQRKWERDAIQHADGRRLDCEGSGINVRCGFPQFATINQSFSREEFEAYMALGRYIVNEEIAEYFIEME